MSSYANGSVPIKMKSIEEENCFMNDCKECVCVCTAQKQVRWDGWLAAWNEGVKVETINAEKMKLPI